MLWMFKLEITRQKKLQIITNNKFRQQWQPSQLFLDEGNSNYTKNRLKIEKTLIEKDYTVLHPDSRYTQLKPTTKQHIQVWCNTNWTSY